MAVREELQMKIIESKMEYEGILKENELVLVDFFADWCGPCKMLSPVIEQLAEVEKDLTVIKVNVDKTPDVAAMYGIMSIPTLIVFKNGEVAATGVGFQPIDAIRKLVAKAR